MAEAKWDSFKIQLPGKDFLEPVRNVLETLLVFLEVLKAILDIVKAFLIDFPNPIAALVLALIKLVTTFFESINRTGLYAWYDVPNPLEDPHYFRFQGGYPAFIERFKAGVLDTRDPYRPQPISGATQSGFIAIVCDAEGPVELVRLIGILLKFFQKELHPRYPAPANVKILPVGDKGDPILNLARVFKIPTKAVMLSWTLGGAVRSPDPGFSDLGAVVGSEFIPPNWIIERSTVPVTGKIKSDDLKKASATGIVTHDIETDHEIRGVPGKRAKQNVRVVDSGGEPILKFQKVTLIKTGLASSSGEGVRSEPLAIIGELGVFKWIDTDVELDKTYYYRIRAYTGDVPVQDGVIQYGDVLQNTTTKQWYAPLPLNVIWGQPSGIFRVRVPKIPPNFNVIDNLRNLFLVAFSLNFHLEKPVGVKFDTNDDPIVGKPEDIGVGSLAKHAGIAAIVNANPIAGKLLKGAGKNTSQFGQLTDPTTGRFLPPPWTNSSVQRQAKRLAGICGSALLEQGSGAISQFQQLMEGPYPKGNPNTKGRLSDAKNLSQMCAVLTKTSEGALTDPDTYQTYGEAFHDPIVRKNALTAVRFATAYLLSGTPPDWIQVSILRDIIPWSGQLLYDILAKIQALLDAFKSVMDEVKMFIDMIERKIDVLERFIQYLLSILDFIMSLEAGFYILRLPSTDGDVFSWLSAIDQAKGAPPPSGPGGYSCGVAFAYVAPDVSAFAEALGLIF